MGATQTPGLSGVFYYCSSVQSRNYNNDYCHSHRWIYVCRMEWMLRNHLCAYANKCNYGNGYVSTNDRESPAEVAEKGYAG